MASSRADTTGPRAPGGSALSTRSVTVGAALLGAAGVLGAAGFAVIGTTLVTAARRRAQDMDRPPAEVVRKHWEKTKAATAAGASAWHDGALAQQH
jgi:hypothetical protein